MSERTVTAALIIIGNEILSGRTQDANLTFLAQALNEVGIQIREVRIVPDAEADIVEAVNALRAKYDHVFTTGGIGPTHDDITSASVGKALGLPFGRHPEAERRLLAYYPPEKVNPARMKMAETGFHNTGVHEVIREGGEGIAAFTLREADLGRFRTPSLRNVAVTAPYMHDGSMATLSEVLDAYANGGRHPDVAQKDPLVAGFDLSVAEKADVIAFLESLTDEDFLSDPALSDPWPAGHPAVAQRVMPCGDAGACGAPEPGG